VLAPVDEYNGDDECHLDVLLDVASDIVKQIYDRLHQDASIEDMIPHYLQDHRLPEDLIPNEYELELRPVFEMVDDSYWYYGSSSVNFTCANPTEKVVLNAQYLELHQNPTLTESKSGVNVPYLTYDFYAPNQFIYFILEEPCKKDMNYTLHFPAFQGELNTDLFGFYRSEYKDENGNNVVIGTSQMEVEGARRTFPCFDEPQIKAEFGITLVYPDGYVPVTNMPAEGPVQTKNIDGQTWFVQKFETTPKMSTYLIAVTVTQFSYVERFTKNGIQTRVYARKTPVDNGEVDYAAEISPQILDTYAALLNVPYPLPKSDQMCVTDFDAGAMENWGLVIYRENYLLYDDVVSSVGEKYDVTEVIAHELAHQWFGNLVTMDYWNEIWLNEGFATFFAVYGILGVQPSWNMDANFVVDEHRRGLYADDSSNAHPLHINTDRPSFLLDPVSLFDNIFDSVTYRKGASFLRMIRGFLGEQVFLDGLHNYLTKNAYNTTTDTDLFDAWIEEASLSNIKTPFPMIEFFNSWVLQRGYPVVTLRRTDSNTITASQDIFFIDANDKPSELEHEEAEKFMHEWYIPFTYNTESELSQSKSSPIYAWMDIGKELTISTNEHILGNVDVVGFYRVNYESDMWKFLIEKLNSTNYQDISVQNRAQLLDDAFAFVRAERLDIATALDLCTYLHQEHEYFPWKMFNDDIAYFKQVLPTTPIYAKFSDYILRLVRPALYDFYGWDDTKDTSDAAYFDRMGRGLGVSLACYFEDSDCVTTAIQLYKDWMNNPTKLIPATYRRSVYCTAIANGGIDEWNFAWDQYLASDSMQHQKTLRYAMSCSRDSAIINTYIDRALDTSLIRKQDQEYTLYYIGSQEFNKYLVFDYVINNYEKITSAVGVYILTNELLYPAMSRFTTTNDLRLIESFRSMVPASWDDTLTSFTYTIEKNIQWLEENEGKIASWLSGASRSTSRLFRGSKILERNDRKPLQRPAKYIEIERSMNHFDF
jgi:aminopeptidase N